MLFVTKYSIRGDRTKERVGALLSVFGERGELPGTIAHYALVDGRGGFVISETDDSALLYEATVAYQEWLELESTPILKIEDSVPMLMAGLA